MTDERNPYAAPANPVVSAPRAGVGFNAEGVVLAVPPHARSAGEGAAWVSEGWELFKRQPMALLGFVLVTGILYVAGGMALQLLPVIGGVFASMLGWVLSAGVTLAADRIYRGEEISFDELFAGFRHPARNSLALYGAVYALVSLAISFLAAVLVGIVPFWMASHDLGDFTVETLLKDGIVALLSLGLYLLVLMLLLLPVMMASWFAGALILFHGLAPMQAFSYAFRAVMRNVLPLTVQSLLFWLLMIASVFTLFLGLLVLIPMFVMSWYISYRRICTDLAATATA